MEAIFGMQHRLEEEAVQDDADQMDQVTRKAELLATIPLEHCKVLNENAVLDHLAFYVKLAYIVTVFRVIYYRLSRSLPRLGTHDFALLTTLGAAYAVTESCRY